MGKIALGLLQLRAAQSGAVYSINLKTDRAEAARELSRFVSVAFDELAAALTDATPREYSTDLYASKEADALDEMVGKIKLIFDEMAQRANRGADIHPKHKPEVRRAVWDLTGGRCAYCDAALKPDGCDGGSFVVEHVVPVSSGGPDNLANYVPACGGCNTGKSNGHVLDFIRKRMGKVPQEPRLAIVGVDA